MAIGYACIAIGVPGAQLSGCAAEHIWGTLSAAAQPAEGKRYRRQALPAD